MSKKAPGGFWWLLIGWWWVPCKWLVLLVWQLIVKQAKKQTITASSSRTPAEPPTKTEPYMYVTASGKKFHWNPNCPGLHNATPFKMPLSAARAADYTACDKCCYSYLHD